MDQLSAALGVGLTFFALAGLIGWVLWLLVKRQERRMDVDAQLRMDQFNAVLNRFSNATEFIDFMRTPSGERFLATMAATGSNPTHRLATSLRRGVLCLLLGLGFFLLVLTHGPDYAIGGVLLTALGIGFFASAGITWMLMRRDASTSEP